MPMQRLISTAGLAALMLGTCASGAAAHAPQSAKDVRALLASALPAPTGVPANKGPEAGTTLTEAGLAPTGTERPQSRGLKPFRYQLKCLPQWFWITNVPAGFVIGECKKGWLIDNQVGARAFHNTPWGGGRIRGNFDGCGWINARLLGLLNRRTVGNACRSPSRGNAEFILRNPKDGKLFIWSHPTKPEDGKPAPNARACPAYQNYRPWTRASRPANPTHVIPANAKMADGVTDRIRVRYVTRYPSTDGSGYYFMARDLALQSGQGNWVFIPITCIL